MLLLEPGYVVTVARLMRELWGDTPPPTAAKNIQGYVHRLRRILADAGVTVRTGGGYALETEPGDVDVTQFRRLVSAATRRPPAEADDLLTDALGLWHGPALAGIATDSVRADARRLEAERLDAVERQSQIRVESGRHLDVIPVLTQLVCDEPLRENPYALLMTALYRAGRYAEALATYRDARSVFVAELGTEPSAQLGALHERILRRDTSLDSVPGDPSPPSKTHEPPGPDGFAPAVDVTTAGQSAGRSVAKAPLDAVTTSDKSGRSAGSVPRQLPGAIRHFSGRVAPLAALHRLLDEGDPPAADMRIATINGMAGVGKTSLALHWAHLVASDFPDGQLYCNLRGFDAALSPTDPMDVLRALLNALGLPAQGMPQDLDSMSATYRSLLAGRRTLIVLDNVRDADQVRPLLPGSPTCLALVTSSDPLTSLTAIDGAIPLNLGLFNPAEARELLHRRLGRQRVAAAPRVTDDLIALCARLPLALTVACARAETTPSLPLAGLVAQLKDSGGRLDALDAGHPPRTSGRCSRGPIKSWTSRPPGCSGHWPSIRVRFPWPRRQAWPAPRLRRPAGTSPSWSTSAWPTRRWADGTHGVT